MTQIIPTILVQTQKDWLEELTHLRSVFSRVQIDIIDGRFVANKTIDMAEMVNLEGLQIDIHLMAEEPINWVEPCRGKGASLVIGQIEKMTDQKQFIEMVKLGNMKAGLALDLETDVSRLDSNVINLVDHILLMSVKAGFSGQLFDKRVLAKIKIVKQMVTEGIEISVDGGVNETNIRSVVEAGADVVYVGTDLVKSENIEATYQNLLSLITNIRV